MAKKTPDEQADLRKFLYEIMQPTRMEVLEVLVKATDPLYIQEIAKLVDAHPRNVSFHLAKLADLGVVIGEYKPIASESGKPGKFFKVSPEKEKTVKRLIEIKI